jgi:hypothetical protein
VVDAPVTALGPEREALRKAKSDLGGIEIEVDGITISGPVAAPTRLMALNCSLLPS